MRPLKKQIHRLFLILMVTVGLNVTIAQNQNMESCTVRSFNELDLSPEMGQLLYFAENNSVYAPSILLSTDADFTPFETIRGVELSPDGRLLGFAIPSDEIEAYFITFQNLDGNQVFVSPPLDRTISITGWDWLSGNRLLTIVAYDGGDAYAAFTTTNPLTQEVRYVHPILRPPSVMDSFVEDAGWAPAEETTPLFETDIFNLVFQQFSPDGRYFISGGSSVMVFDVTAEPAQLLELRNMSSGRWEWATTSDRLARLDVTEERVQVITFDLNTDTSTLLTEIAVNWLEVETRLYPQSWSSGQGIFLVLRPMLPTAQGIVGQPPTIIRIDDVTGSITETCLQLSQNLDIFEGETYVMSTNEPQFQWSRDGRYLAFHGTVDGYETRGLYIYDAQTSDIYDVHQGEAVIVGWAVLPSED